MQQITLADVVLCVFYIRGSRNFRQGGGGGGEGVQAEKAPLPGKKLWQVIFLFLVLTAFQLFKQFYRGGGGSDFFV